MTRSELINELAWHVLIQYLAKRDLLTAWLDNIESAMSTYTVDYLESQPHVLSGYSHTNPGSGFAWLNSPEGHQFWAEVLNVGIEYERTMTLCARKVDQLLDDRSLL